MAHRDKHNDISATSEAPGGKYDAERKTFFLSDYETWPGKKYHSFNVFCFLIKGQPEAENPEVLSQVATAISNDEDFPVAIENGSHPIFKEYRKFLEHFFAGKYLVKKSRPEENNTPV